MKTKIALLIVAIIACIVVTPSVTSSSVTMQAPSSKEIAYLAAIIYGEAAGDSVEEMHLVGSTVLNRLSSHRDEEFGKNIYEIGKKGYWAVRNRNVPFCQAIKKSFPSEDSRIAYEKAWEIASALLKNELARIPGEFYFTPKELRHLIGAHDFSMKDVRVTGKVKEYLVLAYKN
jgi:hypothetical protein